MVESGLRLMLAPPQSEPPMCPGLTSTKSSSSSELAHGPEEAPGTLLGLDGEVGAGQIADEERVPGEEHPGLLGTTGVLYEEREVLGTMAGGGYGD